MKNKLNQHQTLSYLFITALILWGCQTAPTPTLSATTNAPYPPLASTLAPYPINTPGNQAYPVATAYTPKYVLTLDPIRTGDIHVTGSGPIKLPIQIVDVSRTGKVLGAGIINESGHFDIPINPVAIGGNRIGILLGDLTGTTYRQEDFSGRDMPLIGLILTSTMTIK